ncbi:Uncharacterised protein [Myroides odoratus]|nr:Uncharacterised protein [Myroides odoratus]
MTGMRFNCAGKQKNYSAVQGVEQLNILSF